MMKRIQYLFLSLVLLLALLAFPAYAAEMPLMAAPAGAALLAADPASELLPCELKEGDVVVTLPVIGAGEDLTEMNLVCDENIRFLCPGGDWHNCPLDIPDELQASFQKGQVLGSMKVTLEDGSDYVIALVAEERADAMFAMILSKYLPVTMGVLMALIVVLVLYLIFHKEKTPAQKGDIRRRKEERKNRHAQHKKG